MKLVNKALVIFTAASLFCAAGCKKSETDTKTNDAPAVEKTALVDVSNTPWVKEDVNSLLAYIPADTALVFSSTRQFDMDSPLAKERLKKAVEYFDKTITESEQQLNETATTDEEKLIAKKVIDDIKSLRPLISDYEKTAPEWGLDPKGHIDDAIYLVGKTLVFKMTSTDSSKLRAKLETVFDSLIKYPLQLAGEQVPEATEIKAGNTTWKAYNLKNYFQPEDKSVCIMCQNDKTVLNDMIAVNYDNNIITLALVNEGDTETLEKILKPAESPISKAALGSIKDNTEALAFVDNIKLFDVIAHSDMARIFEDEELLGEKLSPECEKDIASLVAILPKYTISSELTETGITAIKSTLHLANKDELKAIQALTTEHLKLGSAQSLAAFGLNFNIDKTLTWLNGLIEKADAMKFECKNLNPLIPKSLKSDLQGLNDPQIKMFTSAINGINAAMDKLKKTDDGNFEVEVVANITGPTLGTSYPMITSLAAAASPEIGRLLSLTKGEIAEKDLTPYVDIPLKVNALLNDTDLVIGTSTYDVKAIAASERKNDGTILSLNIDFAFLAAFGVNVSDIGDNSKYDFEIGTNDDGIALNVNIHP